MLSLLFFEQLQRNSFRFIHELLHLKRNPSSPLHLSDKSDTQTLNTIAPDYRERDRDGYIHKYVVGGVI